MVLDTGRRREWFEQRVRIADDLVSRYGERIASYDAAILLCCALSAFAATLWPGRGIDRSRYIEFLIQFARPQPPMDLVSIPRLVFDLKEKGLVHAAASVEKVFYPKNGTRVVTWNEVDKSESDVLQGMAGIAQLSAKDVRPSSYAGVIYIDLRSGLVHEYSLREGALSPSPMSQRKDIPHYFNWVRPEGLVKELYLPYAYVRETASSAANRVLDHWDRASSWELPRPVTWWIEG